MPRPPAPAPRQATVPPQPPSKAPEPASRPSARDVVAPDDAGEREEKQADRRDACPADSPLAPLPWPAPCQAAPDAARPAGAAQDGLDEPAPAPDGRPASAGADGATPDGPSGEAMLPEQTGGDDPFMPGTEDAAPMASTPEGAGAETPPATQRPDSPPQQAGTLLGEPPGTDGEQGPGEDEAAKAQRRPDDADGAPGRAGLDEGAGPAEPDGGTQPRPPLPGSGAQAALLPAGQLGVTIHAAGGGELPAAGPAAPQHGTPPEASPASFQAQAPAPHRQLADAIVRTRDDGIIEIRLDPVELGRVTVLLGTDHRSGLGILAERLETLDLIRRHSDQLLQDLHENGMPDARLDFMRQDSRSGGGQARDGRARQAGADADLTQMPAMPPAPAPVPPVPILAPSRIDIRL
ncbi:flagellar hook-length control protein FliK [Paracoccus contaminans]|nr:flagellar hook-length control protein FliK [Paracoccus contaminans]